MASDTILRIRISEQVLKLPPTSSPIPYTQRTSSQANRHALPQKQWSQCPLIIRLFGPGNPKKGCWRSATFKEYIREELACFSEGMSTIMKWKFGFVNIAGGAYHDVTTAVLSTPYGSFALAA